MKSKSMNEEMRDHIFEAVQKVQSSHGRAEEALTVHTRPIGDLPGFDAADGVAATRVLEGFWSCPFGDNLFLSWKGTRPQSVDEIVGEMLILQAHGY